MKRTRPGTAAPEHEEEVQDAGHSALHSQQGANAEVEAVTADLTSAERMGSTCHGRHYSRMT
eukprot:3305127-Amphidinium_carterae.1